MSRRTTIAIALAQKDHRRKEEREERGGIFFDL
jgi:hypothetical protein